MTTRTRSSHGGTKPTQPLKKKRKIRAITGLTREALTNALSSPKNNAHVVRGFEGHSGTLVMTKTGVQPKGKKVFLRPYLTKGAGTTEPLLVRSRREARLKQSNTTSIAVDDNKPIAERLRVLGARPGNRLEGEQVVKVFALIRAGAEQVTGSIAIASEILANTDFDGTGMTAEELVREGRAGRVLSRLDDLRYGARG